MSGSKERHARSSQHGDSCSGEHTDPGAVPACAQQQLNRGQPHKAAWDVLRSPRCIPTHWVNSSGSSGRLETAHIQPALALQEARHSCPPVWGTTSPQKVPSPCWGLPKSSLCTGWARGVVLLGWTHGNMIQKYCHFREKRKVWEELYGRVSNRSSIYPVPHLP